MQRVVGFQYGRRAACVLVEDFDALSNTQPLPAGWPDGIEFLNEGGLVSLRGSDGVEVPMVSAYWFAWHAAFPQGITLTNRND